MSFKFRWETIIGAYYHLASRQVYGFGIHPMIPWCCCSIAVVLQAAVVLQMDCLWLWCTLKAFIVVGPASGRTLNEISATITLSYWESQAVG